MNTINHKRSAGSNRPYERCLEFGASALTDAELLAVIIRTGTRGMTSVELAERLLSLPKCADGLTGLIRLSIPELMTLPGIGTVKAIELTCIAELSKRIASSGARRLVRITDPETIADYYMEQLRHEEQENIICMMLDNKNQLIGDECITKGTVNASLLSARELFLSALKFRAVNIILIHNHPSGDPTPSEQDMIITKRIAEAGKMLDIRLLDHIVIGNRCFVSFAANGYLSDGSIP